MKKNNETVTKLRTGDEVIVIAGKDIGKKGTVQKISKFNNKAVITGINLIKKHTKPNPQLGETGGILEKEYNWLKDHKKFQNWVDGRTSEPFVNANMIELKCTGWMSNRGRQNVASFLSKELLIDWRWGANYFESMLIDYDVHSNYGNWMYVSGVGNDPRDRKFNIKFQADRYDPNNKFQNLWLQGKLFV